MDTIWIQFNRIHILRRFQIGLNKDSPLPSPCLYVYNYVTTLELLNIFLTLKMFLRNVPM
jgi:hypothetical protein